MCDRANHDSCEIVYDLELEIDNLNQRIKELEALVGPIGLEQEGWADVDIYNAGVDY